ncbi:MAG: indole-3-glycerol phosphate synthase TrpC [Clostridiales bacterium]|jgi:indole-3-glycerol phosphate synthase|nr:indole-3-glycerol phosphate synthase TrpC [Clostridiales bacterium]
MILDIIAESARKRVLEAKKKASLEEVSMRARAISLHEGFPFEKALAAPGMSFICELKKASPSKGVISEDFPYLDIAADYEAAGADAISVLTEPEFFLGNNEYLRETAAAVSLPVLRKDFIIDVWQIYEAKTLGASAVLLICSLLGEKDLAAFIQVADSLGLSSLVEVHSEDEARLAASAGSRIIGVNNRDLKTFAVDMNTSARLRDLIPSGVLAVSESGVKTREDILAMSQIGMDAVLVGEALMKAPDRRGSLRELKEGKCD